MNLFTIAFKSIRQRALASSLTAFSVALGIMLLVAVLVIYGIVERMFNQRSIGYDLIVGPKGSDLQLVLSSVYRISPPIENLPYKYYEDLKNDSRIAAAVPVALGDTTEEGDFPIVGTTGAYFTNDYAPRQQFRIRWKEGQRGFKTTLDAIIGSEVARKNGWDIGSKFRMIHGGQDDHVHDEKFEVVGVMARTATPNDKSVFVHLEGFYGIADHGKPFDEAVKRLQEFYGVKYTTEQIEELRRDPAVRKEVTSVFIKMRRPPDDPQSSGTQLAYMFSSELKKGFKAQAVNPIQPMQRLMEDVVGNVRNAVVVLIALIIVVSGLSIFVSIYNSMADRRKEIAVMRALGARRQTVFSIILAESVLLCFGGGLAGLALGHGLVFLAAPFVEAETGLLIDPLAFEPMELVLLPALIGLASLVGFVPGLTAYRTDVAKTLTD